MRACKLSSPSFAVVAAVIGGIACAVSTCRAAVIDLFVEQPRTLEHLDPGAPPATDTAGLTGSLFETRRLTLGNGRHRLEVSTGGGGWLDYQSTPGDPTSNYFEVVWWSPEPVDLLADGASVLRLTFTTEVPYLRLPFRFAIASEAGRGSVGNGHRDLATEAANGVHHFDIPLALYDDVDLSRVTTLTFSAFRVREDNALRLLSVTTIPEPGPGCLLAAGMTVLAAVRRRGARGRSGNRPPHPAPRLVAPGGPR